MYFGLDIEYGALEESRDQLQSQALQRQRVAAPGAVCAHHQRIRVRRQPGEAIAAVTVNAIKELVTEVAQVEGQQPVSVPNTRPR
jgi:hypothetical protein